MYQKALTFCFTSDGNWKLKAFKLIFENPFLIKIPNLQLNALIK